MPIYLLLSKFLKNKYIKIIIKIVVYISGIPNSVKLLNSNVGDMLFSKFFLNYKYKTHIKIIPNITSITGVQN